LEKAKAQPWGISDFRLQRNCGFGRKNVFGEAPNIAPEAGALPETISDFD
jgi:hypothetical protein